MPDNLRSGYRGAEQIIQWGKYYCEWIETCFDRAEKLKPCPTGAKGACCKHCHMGPCRFVHGSEERVERGVCGATSATVAARNFLRMAVSGAAAHTDHARDMALTLLGVATGEIKDFRVSALEKLQKVAGILEIEFEGRAINDVARDVAEGLIADFKRQKGVLSFIRRAPKKTQERWQRWDITPEGIDREIVEAIYRTNIGVDHDPDSLLMSALKVSLADGWGASMIATDIADILFGAPQPVKSEAGMGIFKEDTANIVVIGHDPTLTRVIIDAASEPDMIEYARLKGASGITIGDTFGMRHGIPMTGGFTNQELCIMTGLIDAMVVAAHRLMPTIVEIANSFHTMVITTSQKARLPGALHILYDVRRAREIAREILRLAIDNYPNRTGMGERVTEKFSVIAGFSQEHMENMNGSLPGASFRQLNAAIADGRVRGIVGILGSDNPRFQATGIHKYLVRELIEDDVLVLSTGCGSAACAISGYLNPETALEKAGPGLRKTCEEIGISPVLHLGSSFDNSRILTILSAMADEGGLSDEIAGLPVAIIAPEWMAETEVAFGCYFAASGIPVILGGASPVEASEEVTGVMAEVWFERFGGSLHFEPDPEKMYTLTIEYIDKAREGIKLKEYEYGRH
ncbi:MAG: anaerobic carbon-monoxide dehydrogenase catalytic subunit [Thermodesulfovibrionales bacterium]